MPVADASTPTPLLLVVMGVSGSGKSTVAAQLADRIGLAFVDGDDLHPQSNVEKMHAGIPLDDEDRWPWLDRVAATLAAGSERGGLTLACSALRRVYRDRLRAGTAGLVSFVFLDVTYDHIAQRLQKRVDHFMPPNLLQSQFATLERPGPDEADVITVPAEGRVEDIVTELARRLGR